MNAEILTVGTELLLGDILNSNSQFLSRELAAYGIQLLYQSTVGDNNARLKQVLSLALSRSDMVVITGGLGPTPDDLTRETVCEVLDIPLMLHEESWARIQEYFANTGRELSPSNKKQAMLPEGCVVFPNDHGTAPGCAIERDGHVVILLPGPPAELIPMFNDKVAPYLSKFSGGTIFSQTVGVFGIPESTVAERLADLLSEANPTVAPYAKDGEVTLRVTARAADTETARTLCAPIVEEIRKRLGAAVYGVDSGSLQKAVVTLLKEKGKKIATAESCTAGMLSGRLTEVSGVSSVFECGIAAYSKEIKHQVLGVPEELLEKYGAVSAEVASAMAVGARRVGQADLGIGITGVAGPETSEGKPVGTVFIALADEKRTWVKKIVAGHSGGEREYVRYIATSHALDLTRRYLEALPAVMAGGETLEEPKEAAPQIPVAPKSGKQRRFLATIFPWKGDSLKERVWKIVAWVAVLAVLVTGGLLINQFVLMPVSNRALFGEILEIYGNDPGSLPPDVLSSKKYPEGMLSRFYGLYDRNKDIGGWIKIDGTNVNYPVMKDTRNQFYRDHNYDRRYSPYGVPYFDSTAALVNAQSVNRTLTIYGNNLQDGQMFSDVVRYRELDFLIQHPLVEMNTLFTNGKWVPYAVMVLDRNDTAFSYNRTTFADEAAFLKFVAETRDRSLYDTPVQVEAGDSLLFLSVPADVEMRFSGAEIVVAARRLRDGEDEAIHLTTTTKNSDVIMPEAWRKANPSVTTTARTAQSTAASLTEGASTTGTEGVSGETGESTTVTGSSVPTGSQDGTTSGSTTTTSRASVTTTTTGSTSAPPSGDEPPETTIRDAVEPESVYLRNFRLYDKDAKQLLTISTDPAKQKEELQLALARIVKAEMGNARTAVNSTAAWEAQAVASYTYVLNYNASKSGKDSYPFNFSTVSLDVDGNENDQKIYQAVGNVLGIKILDVKQSDPAKAPIEAMYFASSPGVTANSENVFVSARPYLRSVASTYDTKTYIEKYTNNPSLVSTTYSLSRSDFDAQMQKAFGGTVSYDAGFQVEYDGGPGKYVKTSGFYCMNGSEKRYLAGKDVRKALDNFNGQRFWSHCFRVEAYNNETVTFQVWGAGHGCGMSQTGAMGYANELRVSDGGKMRGWTYDEILTHYYSINKSSRHQLVKPNWNG